jgi:hypothetical protein
MNKEQQELLDKVYKKYQTQTMFHIDDLVSLKELDGMNMSTGERKKVYRQYAPVEFIDKCKTNPEFSKNCGLKIEEKALNAQERLEWVKTNVSNVEVGGFVNNDEYMHKWIETLSDNIPTRLITITYNNKTIESYE